MRSQALSLGLAILLALAAHEKAAAIDWDDAGNSASKLWDDNGNWNPDGDPDVQPVNIGNLANAANDTTLIDRAYTITSLTITNGADVVNSTDGGATNDFELLVNGLTTISGAGSTFFVIGGDPDGLDTEGLTINSGGTLNLNSTTAQGTAVVEIESGLLDLNSGGTIIGQGRIDFDEALGAATSVFINDGTITANRAPIFFGQPPLAGTLQLVALSANARFDWDGGGSGVLQVNGNQTLDIDVTPGAGVATDAFSGTMNLFTGGTIDISSTWSLDSGTINANTPDFGLIIIGQDPNPGPAAHIAGANWTMTGGTISVDDTWDSLEFDSQVTASGGIVNNEGTMIFNGGASFFSGVDFNMIGDGASLVVNSTLNIDTPDFDLDAAQMAGNVTTINAGGNLDLDLGAGADISFGHTINMNGGELDVTTSVATAWQLNSFGVINAAGGATSTINSAGETFQISGDINVTANSRLNISSVSEYFSTANVVIDAGSIVDMNTATYNGGSYTGGGTLRKGLATIDAATTWNVATVDLDDGNTTLNANLTINADAIDDVGDGIDLLIVVNDPNVLTVNINGGGSWTVDPAGAITYNGNASANTYLAGSDIVMNGTFNHFGDGRSDARLDIGSTGTININTAAEPFRLSGGNTTTNPNTIAGGTITGIGILGADSDSELRGFGTISTDVDFDTFANLLADNGTLTVSGAILDVNTIGTADDDGILNVTNAWNNNVAARIDLSGGEVRGGTITNDSINGINGDGLVSARVINNTRIEAENGGTLIVETAANTNDWDGSTNTGSLLATSGNLEVRDNVGFLFNGTVSASTGRTVFANGFELEFDPASTLSLTGGTYRSTNATDIGGTVTIGAGTSTLQISGTTVFEGSSSTTIAGALNLDNAATRINSGATFSGGGTLVNVAGRTLTLADGADVDVTLQNDGTLVLGTSPGQTQGLDFQQTATGAWNVELGGTGINDYDRMTLTGLAALDGTLNLSLLAPYVPSLADPLLTILSASSLGGTTFDNVIQPIDMPAGLMFEVIYNPANVQLMVVSATLDGDYNQDNSVNAADYVAWRKTDGSQAGYDLWFEHFGETVGGGAAASANRNVPEPATLLMVIAAAAGIRLRGRYFASRVLSTR